MNKECLLPAVVMPNQENAQDAVAVIQGGKTIRMTDFLQCLGSTPSLRFMINSKQPKQPHEPRLTWQILTDGEVIVSASFECGKDIYNRITSASVVFIQSKSSELIDTLPNALPDGIRKSLIDGIASRIQEIENFIGGEVAKGKLGGEIDSIKKKSRDFYIRVSLGIILLFLAIIGWLVTK